MNTLTLTLTKPDDWHLHLRDGDKLARTVADAALQFQRAIIMPNLVPPITTVAQAEAYRQRILNHVPAALTRFEPLMTLYLTDNISTKEIAAAADHPHIHAAKLYPAGATTNSEFGVTKLQKIYPVLAAMQEHGLPLLVHGEVTHSDIFDREAIFLDEVLAPLIKEFPELRIVLEHISTKAAVDFVATEGLNLAATITPHHLRYTRNELLVGGIKPHYYCLPILKCAADREALIRAATSGNAKYFLGTDSAPHTIATKQSSCGCAGIYNSYAALPLYAEVFAAANALDKLEAFASFYGADFYGLPRNTQTITLIQEPWEIPRQLAFGNEHIIPLAAGEILQWRIQNDE
jgi:dihydroorotase